MVVVVVGVKVVVMEGAGGWSGDGVGMGGVDVAGCG